MSTFLTIDPFKQRCDLGVVAALRGSTRRTAADGSARYDLNLCLREVVQDADPTGRCRLIFGDSDEKYTLEALASVEQDKPPLKSKITWHEVDGLGLGRITVPKGVGSVHFGGMAVFLPTRLDLGSDHVVIRSGSCGIDTVNIGINFLDGSREMALPSSGSTSHNVRIHMARSGTCIRISDITSEDGALNIFYRRDGRIIVRIKGILDYIFSGLVTSDMNRAVRHGFPDKIPVSRAWAPLSGLLLVGLGFGLWNWAQSDDKWALNWENLDLAYNIVSSFVPMGLGASLASGFAYDEVASRYT